MSKKILLTMVAVGIVTVIVILLNSNKDSEKITTSTGGKESGSLTQRVPAPSEDQKIVISGHSLPRRTITIPVGTTVIFENKDRFSGLPYDAHTITTGQIDSTGKTGTKGIVPNSGSGVPDSLIQASLGTNEIFSFTFAEAGTYSFYIAEHPTVSGEGKITVEAVNEMVVEGDTIQMETKSFSFNPDIITTTVGETVKIEISSSGQHTFTIDELNVNVPLLHGKVTTVEFTPDKQGTFQFYCAVPGHREAGQIGTITVK